MSVTKRPVHADQDSSRNIGLAGPAESSPTSADLSQDLDQMEAEEKAVLDRQREQELSRLRETARFD